MRGVAAVEFAMIASVISMLLIGLASYGLAMFEEMELTSAARAGAQVALIDSSDTVSIEAAVIASTNLDPSAITVSFPVTCFCKDGSELPSCTDDCATVDGSTNRYYLTVTVSEEYDLLLLPTTLSLSGEATVRIR